LVLGSRFLTTTKEQWTETVINKLINKGNKQLFIHNKKTTNEWGVHPTQGLRTEGGLPSN
jgi:hypothetical protein